MTQAVPVAAGADSGAKQAGFPAPPYHTMVYSIELAQRRIGKRGRPQPSIPGANVRLGMSENGRRPQEEGWYPPLDPLPSPPEDPDFIVGKNEIYSMKYWRGLLLVHKLCGSRTPPPPGQPWL